MQEKIIRALSYMYYQENEKHLLELFKDAETRQIMTRHFSVIDFCVNNKGHAHFEMEFKDGE